MLDPLAYAVENAWRHGIVVVVAAGNDGTDGRRLNMPAVDPFVVAVGASDTKGTDDPTDDTLANFSSVGNRGRRPDLLAPGRSIVVSSTTLPVSRGATSMRCGPRESIGGSPTK